MNANFIEVSVLEEKAVKQESKKANIISWYGSHWAEFYILITQLQVSDRGCIYTRYQHKAKLKKIRMFKINLYIVEGQNRFLSIPTMIYTDWFFWINLLFKVCISKIFFRIHGSLTADLYILFFFKRLRNHLSIPI